MAESDEEKAKSLLDQLVSSVQGSKQAENAGWIGGLIVAILAMIVIAIFAFQAWKKGKEMAKIKHELAVQKEHAHQAELDAELAQSAQRRSDALRQAQEARAEAIQLDIQLAEVRDEHRKAIETINSIASWDDVDRYRGSN